MLLLLLPIFVSSSVASAAEAPEPEVEVVAPAPLTSEDKAALKRLGLDLPLHGVATLKAPDEDAADEAWLRHARKLIGVFAPDSLKSSEKKALLDVRPLGPAVTALVPRHRRYRALQALLVVYAKRMGEAPTPIPETSYKVKVGSTAPEVGLLRDRLRAEGYGDEGVQGKLRDYFDDRLKRALQAWQKDHDLPPTVVLDSLTRRRLNEPISMPVADIALALARFRALDLRVDEGRHILVHINDYRLIAERNGAPELAMPVVVGKNTERDRTPAMSTRVETVIANPSWGVPQRIIDEKLRVDAKDIPEMLIDKGYDVTVEPSGKWRVRMGPGPDNPLGKLKFQLAGTNGVYMHDTNARSAFAKDERSLSHGCVRLSDPLGLARWVLPERDIDLDEALAYATFTTSFDVASLPTHLVYQTVLVEDGRLVRFPDIYGKDAEALAGFDGQALATAARARAR